MNRTDRLYALVEELRAVSPRPRSAQWLAARFEVDERTVRRDIAALQQAGVPVYAETGRRGGYVVDKAHTLPPVNITPREAVATAIALDVLVGTPFADAARSVLHKLLAVMPERDVVAARSAAARVHLVTPSPGAASVFRAAPADPAPSSVTPPTGAPSPGAVPADPGVLRAAEEAVVRRAVLAIDYVDRHGTASRRLVEPVALLGDGPLWYLVGWCRLRGGEREFRLDRVRRATATLEVAPSRPLAPGRLRAPSSPASRALPPVASP
ncbi:WYL domain-containing protein [Actinomycetes bacterium KLBMP 9797]